MITKQKLNMCLQRPDNVNPTNERLFKRCLVAEGAVFCFFAFSKYLFIFLLHYLKNGCCTWTTECTCCVKCRKGQICYYGPLALSILHRIGKFTQARELRFDWNLCRGDSEQAFWGLWAAFRSNHLVPCNLFLDWYLLVLSGWLLKHRRGVQWFGVDWSANNRPNCWSNSREDSKRKDPFAGRGRSHDWCFVSSPCQVFNPR